MEGICNPGSHMLNHMPDRIPIDGTFELTVRCNLHCKMCLFRHDDSENKAIRAAELSTRQWINLADQAAEAGTFSLLLTGGEPMLRPDFCEIYEGIYQKGFLLTLYTNATLVTPKIMETLRKYPPHKIGITVYGSSADIYEKVCGNANAFDQMYSGVQQLLTLPSKIEFRTTIIRDNYRDMDAIERLVREKFQYTDRLTQSSMVLQSVRGACADVNSCRIDPEDNVQLSYQRSINIMKQYLGNDYSENNVNIEKAEVSDIPEDKPTLFGCEAGMSSYVITWDGKLIGCQLFDLFHEEVINQSFKKAWEKYPFLVKIPALNTECQKCQNLADCSCCYVTRYIETGDLGGKTEYICRYTNAMHELLIQR